ncbi:MAG: NADP-specific glutamate dehydrogenase [Peptoniphilaceae bacterium]|nr:NADP-specific glutamate dehydrogenase [Peptoniphilaceae bacterium]MDD7383400.1 NADP-specific glutamate dehydrogenase [Peptoniphilaceae bacterium]MDY3738795.1 NADP-specific glutamate dehydrogenase [Peptoniphilaceae bacterium]
MSYLNDVLENIKAEKDGKFYEAVSEFFDSLKEYIDENEEFLKKNAILEKLTTPDRIIQFKVVWNDDNGNERVNNGYRVQFNNSLGPYKGGLRFAENVNVDTFKFLGFEQIFKNALTGQPIGGAKGGSDFTSKGKSENEIKRFCQSFMSELFKYIGPYQDVPAGDIGVSSREIGYLFGQYKKLTNQFNGTLTGKNPLYGGLNGRSEATGYGLLYITKYLLENRGLSLEGKTVVVSGAGNVASFAIKKATELGAKVLTFSNSKGYVLDEEGIDVDLFFEVSKNSNNIVKDYAEKRSSAKYFESEKPWKVKADIVLPCATENEINREDAKTIVSNGTICIAEGANMPTDNEAKEVIFNKKDLLYIPAKAANCGGVSSSLFEMSQDSGYVYWSSSMSDKQLDRTMKNLADDMEKVVKETGKDYQYAANYLSFKKVVKAIVEQGL